MRNTINSPYSAAFTGGSLLHAETNSLLSMMTADNADELIREEVHTGEHLCINSETARSRTIAEMRRRYNSVPVSFWVYYKELSESLQPIYLFYTCLKTYRMLFDFHVDITVRLWNQGKKELDRFDYEMKMGEIGSKDEFVDSWSEATKKKCISVYITMLKQAGFIKDNQLVHPNIEVDDLLYFARIGDTWFLESCFMPAYEITELKTML